jgi:hypothetical protein
MTTPSSGLGEVGYQTKTHKAYQEPWGTPPRAVPAMILLQIQVYTASLLRSKVLLGYLDGQCQGYRPPNFW